MYLTTKVKEHNLFRGGVWGTKAGEMQQSACGILAARRGSVAVTGIMFI